MDQGLLQLSGVQATRPTRFTPLTTQTFFTGLWTQRTPFNGPDNRAYTRAFGGRPDAIIDGNDIELTNYGSLIRRPGLLAFSTEKVTPPILSFYAFHQIANIPNPIDVIVDTETTVYNVTPTAKTTILTKGDGAGQAYFQGVGNTLYIGDGVEEQAWTDPGTPGNNPPFLRKWGISIGQFGGASGPHGCGTGSDVAITGSASAWSYPARITAADASYSYASLNVPVAYSQAKTPLSRLNYSGGFFPWSPGSPNTAIFTLPGFGYTRSDTLKISNCVCSVPVTATITGVKVEITASQVSGSPVTTLSVALAGIAGGSLKLSGALSTTPTLFTFGSSSDLWSGTISPSMVNSSAFGADVFASFTASGSGQTVTVSTITITVYYTVVATGLTDLLEATNFGLTIPATNAINGIQVEVKGYQLTAPAGSSFSVQLLKDGALVGSPKTGLQLPNTNGYVTLGSDGDLWGTSWNAGDLNKANFGVAIQAVATAGGGSITWYIDYVRITLYGSGGPSVTVSGVGALTATSASGYSYMAAYGNSNTGHVSSCTSPSIGTGPFNLSKTHIAVVASTDPQVNQIWLFRTKDGGGVYYALPQQYANSTTTIDDEFLDADLIVTQPAPLSPLNNPPPTGFTKMAYHVGRIWGVVGNNVYYSGGPDTVVGNGFEAFPPANVFTFPDVVNKLVPISGGLVVYTASSIYIIYGTGIATFYADILLENVGLSSYNALDTQGTNTFLYTADRQFQLISAAGITEIGFGIGNLLESTFDPTTTYVASIVNGTSDKAVFISDGSSIWYRCNWNQPPEGGPSWSPKAVITGGVTAIGGIEVSPGVTQLLVGLPDGTVAIRALNTMTDLGATYMPSVTLGSLVLAHPGQLAEVQSISVELPNLGTVPTVSVRLDEIDGPFEDLPFSVNDPAPLAPSNSVLSKRFYLTQGGQPTVCRHMQIKLDFAAEAFQNQLYTLSIFGALLAKE
jgi:hypothetical protein